MRMPEPGPFGETFFEANVLAMVAASLVNSPAGGWVESVVTFATHLLVFFLAIMNSSRSLVLMPAKSQPKASASVTSCL